MRSKMAERFTVAVDPEGRPIKLAVQDMTHGQNRGGNRQANAALHRIVVTRKRGHQPTIDYVARRTREGKTKPEIMRCLKRYVAREVFALIRRRSIPAPEAP